MKDGLVLEKAQVSPVVPVLKGWFRLMQKRPFTCSRSCNIALMKHSSDSVLPMWDGGEISPRSSKIAVNQIHRRTHTDRSRRQQAGWLAASLQLIRRFCRSFIDDIPKCSIARQLPACLSRPCDPDHPHCRYDLRQRNLDVSHKHERLKGCQRVFTARWLTPQNFPIGRFPSHAL